MNSLRARNQIATKPSQRFGTPTVECPQGGDVHKYASAEERTTKKQKTTIRYYCYCGSAVIEMPSWKCRFLRHAIAVGARRRRAGLPLLVYI